MKCKTGRLLIRYKTSPSHSFISNSSPLFPYSRASCTKHVFLFRKTYILGDTSSIYVPLEEEEKNASFISTTSCCGFPHCIQKQTRIDRVEETRQDRRRLEAATASQRARLLLEGTPPSRTHPRADRARARRAERLHPTPASSREPRKYGRVFLRSPACLVFHFCFSGSGRARGAERQRNVPALCRPAGDVRASHPGGRGAPSRRTQGKPLLKKKKKMTPSQPVLTLASSTTLFRNDGDDDNSLRTRWTPARP